MVRATPATRAAREAFAARLREVRKLEHDGQVDLHDLRRTLGRPLRFSDIPDSRLEVMVEPADAARRAGFAVLGDYDRVDTILGRAFRLEKKKVDEETGFDVRH